MKINALLSALLVTGSLTMASSSAHATFGLLGGIGSICTTPSGPTGIDCTPSLGGGLFGENGGGDLFGNLLGGSGSICTTPLIGPPASIGTVCNPPIVNNNCDLFGNPIGGGLCDLFGNPIGGGINCQPGGGGIGNNCNPPSGGTGGGTSPVPEPGSIALLALGATALGGTVLRRRK